MKRWLIMPLVHATWIVLLIVLATLWFACRIEVADDQCAVLIRKMGKPLGEKQMVATEPGQRGIQEEVLGPGRYFYNPIVWDWELKPLTVIPAGNPGGWKWEREHGAARQEMVRTGQSGFSGEFPQTGMVTYKIGRDPEPGQVVVDRGSGVRGVLREVLTPGTYKINPYVCDVELCPAVVIPAGFVGVVTNLFGAEPAQMAVAAGETVPAAPPVVAPEAGETATTLPPAPKREELISMVRPLAKPGERGTLEDVLQPGVYFINPKLQKVTPIEIGFNEYSQVKVNEKESYRIVFPSDTGFTIQVEVTVIWGIDPRHAAQTINTYGNIDGVLDKVVGPQLRSICRNIGSTYAARDFIHGEKREEFQRALTAELQRVCRAKNIEVLLALIREIEVHAPPGSPDTGDVTEDLKRTIQQSYIAIEKQLTKQKQREAATVKAHLEEVRKEVGIAQETVAAQTRVLVAGTLAEGEKSAAQTDAQAGLEVAEIQQEVAQLDARRTEILGGARTDVEKMKKQAEADGYKLLINAFGTAQAFNLYTFAEHFQPESIQLVFAGEGTFWTDLSRLEEVGAARLLQRREKTGD
ncbi:MAG TPA: SPFH domain-containing protein [Phycisphaerae bacterium]|nr:SPFH domain-containing protein [Phycisphaerae bacterium]HNU46431.1 SPFH domain-containing protein [Phycisphaerae bacterium]